MADTAKLTAPTFTPGHWFIDPGSGNTIRTAKRGALAVVCGAPPYVEYDVLAMRAAPQLVKALLEALALIEEDRRTWFDSNVDPDGKIASYHGQRELERYDAAIRHAREALLQAGCRS